MSRAPYEKYVEELGLDLANPGCLSNKVALCSYLVCCGASVDLESYPLNDKDFRTGNAGLQLLVGNPALRALVPFLYMDGDNPVSIKGSYPAKKAVVQCHGRELFEVEILPDRETGNANVNLEFDTLIAAIPNAPNGKRTCVYQARGRGCAFCILSAGKVDLGPADLVKAYEKAARARGAEPNVLLTGGNAANRDRGLAKYAPYVRELRTASASARIAVEAAPPQDPGSLDLLIELGLDTFAANIEFFSDDSRNALLPGKCEIRLDEYARTLEYCSDAGLKTFSAVIAGPERAEDTLNGVRFLADLGVPANFLCVRPFTGSAIEDYPRVNPAWFLKLTQEANRIMDSAGLLDDLFNTAGCGSCGGCSMEMNLYRLREAGSIIDLDGCHRN